MKDSVQPSPPRQLPRNQKTRTTSNVCPHTPNYGGRPPGMAHPRVIVQNRSGLESPSFPSIRLLLLLRRWRSECVARHLFFYCWQQKIVNIFVCPTSWARRRLAGEGERLVRTSRRINEFVYRSVEGCAKRVQEN